VLCNRAFGKVIPIKPILSKLGDLFNHTDKDVRKETTALTLELYRYIGGEPLAPMIEKLRAAQAKDLEAQFATVQPRSATPERLLRSVMEQQVQGGMQDAEQEAEPAGCCGLACCALR
jgi:hypothetical protein